VEPEAATMPRSIAAKANGWLKVQIATLASLGIFILPSGDLLFIDEIFHYHARTITPVPQMEQSKIREHYPTVGPI
jgi:hypothetical protein